MILTGKQKFQQGKIRWGSSLKSKLSGATSFLDGSSLGFFLVSPSFSVIVFFVSVFCCPLGHFPNILYALFLSS